MAAFSASEQKIVDLCTKVLALQDTDDFEPAMRELRAALHEQLQGARDRIADFALDIAALDTSQAAD